MLRFYLKNTVYYTVFASKLLFFHTILGKIYAMLIIRDNRMILYLIIRFLPYFANQPYRLVF